MAVFRGMIWKRFQMIMPWTDRIEAPMRPHRSGGPIIMAGPWVMRFSGAVGGISLGEVGHLPGDHVPTGQAAACLLVFCMYGQGDVHQALTLS
jgi:hypothetical protein